MKPIFIGLIIIMQTTMQGFTQNCFCDRMYTVTLSNDSNRIWNDNIWVFIDESYVENNVHSFNPDTLIQIEGEIKWKIISYDCKGSALILRYDSAEHLEARYIFTSGIDTLKYQATIMDPWTGDITKYYTRCYFEGILVEYELYNIDGTIYEKWRDKMKWRMN